MRPTLRRTREGLAIVPGLLLCGLLLSACEERSGPSTENIALCLAETTPIETVQGDSWRSPLEGTRQTVGGVVTVVDPDLGFYLEQRGRRENPQRSGGLFIESPLLSKRARPGQLWVLEGTVVERGEQRDTVTTLSDTVLHAVCEEGLPLPSTEVSLPLSGPEREALESMRIRFGAELLVTDVYSQHRGMLTLSTGEPLWVPTEYMDPGSTAAAGFRRNRAHSIDVENGEITSKMTLQRNAEGTWLSSGSLQGKELEFEIDGALQPSSEWQQMTVARNLFAGDATSASLLVWTPVIDPTRLLEATMTRDDAEVERQAILTMGPVSYRGRFDASGNLENADMTIGPMTLNIERIWSRGSLLE